MGAKSACGIGSPCSRNGFTGFVMHFPTLKLRGQKKTIFIWFQCPVSVGNVWNRASEMLLFSVILFFCDIAGSACTPGGGRGLQNRWAVCKACGRWVRFPCTSAIFVGDGSQCVFSSGASLFMAWDLRPIPIFIDGLCLEPVWTTITRRSSTIEMASHGRSDAGFEFRLNP